MGNRFILTERMEWLVAIFLSSALWLWTGRFAAFAVMLGSATILVLFDRMTGFTEEF